MASDREEKPTFPSYKYTIVVIIYSNWEFLVWVHDITNWSKGLKTLCLKERSSQKRKLQTLILRKKIVVAFIFGDYSELLLKTFVFMAFFFPPLLGDDGDIVIAGLLIHSYQSNCWQAGYDMGWASRTSVEPVQKPASNSQNLVTWFFI